MERQAGVHRSGEKKGICAGYPHFSYPFKPGVPLRFPIVWYHPRHRKMCQIQILSLFHPHTQDLEDSIP